MEVSRIQTFVRTQARTPQSPSASFLDGKNAVLLDKDGVVLDIADLLHENMRRGFNKENRPGTRGMGFEFMPMSTYRLRGLRTDYNSGTKPITAIIAINIAAISESNGPGKSPEERLKEIISNPSGAEELDILISKYASTCEIAKTANRIYLGDKGRFFSSKKAAKHIRPIPGARESVLELLELYGGRLGIITNTPTTSALRRDMAAIFTEKELSKIPIISRQDIAKPKPHPESALRMMERLGAVPETTYMVGDTAVDIETSRNAGIASVGVLSGMAQRHHLEKAGANLILADIQELVSMVRRR